MTSRDRMRAALRRQQPDRVPICDSFWDQTLANWRREGRLPADVDLNEFFGFEWRLVHFDSSFLLPETILEETASHVVRRNAYGTVGKYEKGASAPAELLQFPIRTRKDWEGLKDRLHWNPHRFALTGFYSFTTAWTPPEQDWASKLEGLRRLKDTGDYIALYCYDAFEATWRKMGHEAALIALMEDPDWMAEMFDAQMDLLIEGYRGMVEGGATVDGFFMASDLAFKTGIMFSPEVHRHLCLPGLTRLCEFLHDQDVDMIFHCDGDMRELLPNLVEAGVDCVQPLEVQAGLDVRELKPRYGHKLAFMGNIGVHEMRLPQAQLEDTIAEKMSIARQGGGYIYHSDHSIPPDMPFDTYMHVLKLARKYGQY